MNKQTLTIGIGIGVVALILILIVALSGGLNDQTEARLKAENANYASQAASVSSYRKQVLALMAKDPELFASHKSKWEKSLSQAVGSIATGAKELSGADKLAELNDDDKRMAIDNAVANAKALREKATRESRDIFDTATKLVKLKAEFPTAIKTAEKTADGIESAVSGLTALEAKVEKAQAAWPKKKTDLQGRLNVLTGSGPKAKALWVKIEDLSFEVEVDEDGQPMRVKKMTKGHATYIPIFKVPDTLKKNIDYFAVSNLIDQLNEISGSLALNAKELSGLVDQLDSSWEKLLVDMKIDGSAFYHKYQTIRGSPGGKSKSTDGAWETVAEKKYDINQDNLGMAVAWKPLGLYDHEAETAKSAQPAGYSMVAPAGQKNQYGHWQTNSSGTSYWAFYGQYRLMQDMFWGPSYGHVIYASDYGSYRRSYSSGRSYYGNTTGGTRTFGSKGRMASTSSKYKSSSYRTKPASSSYSAFKTKRAASVKAATAKRAAAARSRSASSRSSYSSFRSRSSGSRSSGGK